MQLFGIDDLEVLNAAGNVAAILPLTPFVTPDHQAFIAPTDVATDFTADDGVLYHLQQSKRTTRIEELRASDRFTMLQPLAALFDGAPVTVENLSARGARVVVPREVSAGTRGAEPLDAGAGCSRSRPALTGLPGR